MTIYYLSSSVFGFLVLGAVIYSSDTRLAICLSAAAMCCLWVRITYLIPAFLAEVKRLELEDWRKRNEK